MAECGQCTAGLAVPLVAVDERVAWGRFCGARSRSLFAARRGTGGSAVRAGLWERGAHGGEDGAEGEAEAEDVRLVARAVVVVMHRLGEAEEESTNVAWRGCCRKFEQGARTIITSSVSSV